MATVNVQNRVNSALSQLPEETTKMGVLIEKQQNIANLKIAKARQEEATLQFHQSLLDADKEVNNALTAWQTAKSQIEIDDSRVETLREAVRKTELFMRYSDTTYLDVLTAQRCLMPRCRQYKAALIAYRES